MVLLSFLVAGEPVMVLLSFLVAALGLGLWLTVRLARRRGLGRWVVPYVLTSRRRAVTGDRPVHLLLCVADHYEPKWGKPSAEVAAARVQRWVEEYPRHFGRFRDSDDRPPQHTFFFPPEEHEPRFLEGLARLCQAGFGEVEVHLHHDNDTAEQMREQLLTYRDILTGDHGLLARRRDTGAVAYGFVHGNWALCNSRPDGRWCGVNDELTILRQTGCYADFTMPSAPDSCQTRKINSIYYAASDPGRSCSHNGGVDAGTGPAPDGSLLLIQRPLLLDWRRRKAGVLSRLENGCLQASQPPSADRVDLWLQARVQVPARPDWYFVKLHTHGATESNARVLLGGGRGALPRGPRPPGCRRPAVPLPLCDRAGGVQPGPRRRGRMEGRRGGSAGLRAYLGDAVSAPPPEGAAGRLRAHV